MLVKNVMVKEISLVLFEAVIVGFGLAILYEIVKMVIAPKEKANYLLLFVSGVIFHLLCEYTGVNQWYSIKYCKLVQ